MTGHVWPFILLFLPFMVLLYMAAEVYFRDPRGGLHRLTAGLILTDSLVLLGSYLAQELPGHSAVLALRYVYFAALLLSMVLGNYFVPTMCKSPVNPILLHASALLPLAGLYYLLDDPFWTEVRMDSGRIWRAFEFPPELALPVLGLLACSLALNSAHLLLAYRRTKARPWIVDERRRLRVFMVFNFLAAAWILLVHVVLPEIFPSFSFVQADTLSLLSLLIYAGSVRYAIFSCDFLSTADRRYEILFNDLSLGIAIMEEDGTLLDANPAYLRLLGITGEDGRSWKYGNIRDYIASIAYDGRIVRSFSFVYRGVDCLQYEVDIVNKANESYFVEAHLQFIETEGRMLLFTMVKDITDWKRRIEADEYIRAKSRYLTRLSHAVRNPLNGIVGLSVLLQKTELTSVQQDYLNKINSASQILLGMIDDVLDVPKRGVGDPKPEKIRFQWGTILNKLADTLSVSLGSKSIEVVFDKDPGLPPTMIGDPFRIEQVLLNLCGNAIKFTHSGYVRLQIRPEARQEGEAAAWISIAVEDTGIGLSEDQQAHLFTPFAQAEVSTSRRYGGSGLGLVICKHLVESMGGQLRVDSRLHQGSRFSFRIPLEPAEEAEDLFDRMDIGNDRVLIVEDSELMRQNMVRMLRSLGVQALAVSSCSELLERLNGGDFGDCEDIPYLILDMWIWIWLWTTIYRLASCSRF